MKRVLLTSESRITKAEQMRPGHFRLSKRIAVKGQFEMIMERAILLKCVVAGSLLLAGCDQPKRAADDASVPRALQPDTAKTTPAQKEVVPPARVAESKGNNLDGGSPAKGISDFLDSVELDAKHKSMIANLEKTGDRQAIAAARHRAGMERLELLARRERVIDAIEFEAERLAEAAPEINRFVNELKWLHRDNYVRTESLEHCLKAVERAREALTRGHLKLTDGVTSVDVAFWSTGLLFMVGEDSPTRTTMYFVIDDFNDDPKTPRTREDRGAIQRFLDAYNEELRASITRRCRELGVNQTALSLRELRIQIDKRLEKDTSGRKKLYDDCRVAARKAFAARLRKEINSGQTDVARYVRLLRLRPNAGDLPIELLYGCAQHADKPAALELQGPGHELSELAALAKERLKSIQDRETIGSGSHSGRQRPKKAEEPKKRPR